MKPGQRPTAMQTAVADMASAPTANQSLSLDLSTGIDAATMNRITYVYLGASVQIDLPAPMPGGWIVLQNATSAAWTLTIGAANLWAGTSKVLTPGQWVRFTAMDRAGVWQWAEL